jgi:hypothetical protein
VSVQLHPPGTVFATGQGNGKVPATTGAG